MVATLMDPLFDEENEFNKSESIGEELLRELTIEPRDGLIM